MAFRERVTRNRTSLPEHVRVLFRAKLAVIDVLTFDVSLTAPLGRDSSVVIPLTGINLPSGGRDSRLKCLLGGICGWIDKVSGHPCGRSSTEARAFSCFSLPL